MLPTSVHHTPNEESNAKTLPDLPSEEAYKQLARHVRTRQRKWTEHLLFLDEEYSCELDISAADSAVPLQDALANLSRVAKVTDFRSKILNHFGFPDETGAEGELCTVEKLLSFMEKPLSTETAASMLRKAAVALEREVQEAAEETLELEALVVERFDVFLHNIGRCQRLESGAGYESTVYMLDCLRKTEAKAAMVAMEPEDAVWAVVDRIAARLMKRTMVTCGYERIVEETVRCWRYLLYQATGLGVKVGGRQALITEYIAYEDEDDDESVSEDDEEEENMEM